MLELCTFATIFLSAPPAELPVRHAIVIGYNQSLEPDIPALHYADDDALATHAMLLEAGVHSILLVELDAATQRLHPELAATIAPTREHLIEAINATWTALEEARATGHTTEFLLFYSGHGDVYRGEGYVSLRSHRFTRTELHQEILERSPATRNHIFVDACRSYFLVFDKGGSGSRQPFVGAPVGSGLGLPANTGVVLSTTSDQESHEWERYQGGIFSHEIRSALRGGADADHDGRVTYAELGAFVTVANSQIENTRFRPEFVVQPPKSSADALDSTILAWPTEREPFIVDRPNVGHIYFESVLGQRIADINVRRSHSARVHLPVERPIFVRQSQQKVEFVLGKRSPPVLSKLSRRRVAVQSRGAVHRAFRRLFSSAFSSDAVDAYETSWQPPVLHDSGLRTVPELATSPSLPWITLWSGIGATATGAALNVWGHQTWKRAQRAPISSRPRLNSELRRLNIAAGIAYGLGVLGVTTWFVWPGTSESDGTLRVQPELGTEAVGISLRYSLRP